MANLNQLTEAIGRWKGSMYRVNQLISKYRKSQEVRPGAKASSPNRDPSVESTIQFSDDTTIHLDVPYSVVAQLLVKDLREKYQDLCKCGLTEENLTFDDKASVDVLFEISKCPGTFFDEVK